MISLFLPLFLFGTVMVSTADGTVAGTASDPAPAEDSAAQGSAADGIGTVAELFGTVTATSEEYGSRTLAEGDVVYLNETIEAGEGASAQIELSDESLFSLSANSTVRMDEFVYDESASDGKMTANIAKGIFRFISGKIAKSKPENVNIDIPSGTIGIRGTIVVGEIDGEKCTVGLEVEEGDTVQHRIVVSNEVDGQKQEVEITKPGFGTLIEARGQAPKPVFALPQENRERFQQNIPQPKYLPRDENGRPQQNAKVQDPRVPVDQRPQRQQNNPGGGPPPGGNGPNGQNPGMNGQGPEGPGGLQPRDGQSPQNNFQNPQGDFQQPGQSPQQGLSNAEGEFQQPGQFQQGGFQNPQGQFPQSGQNGQQNFPGPQQGFDQRGQFPPQQGFGNPQGGFRQGGQDQPGQLNWRSINENRGGGNGQRQPLPPLEHQTPQGSGQFQPPQGKQGEFGSFRPSQQGNFQPQQPGGFQSQPGNFQTRPQGGNFGGGPQQPQGGQRPPQGQGSGNQGGGSGPKGPPR